MKRNLKQKYNSSLLADLLVNDSFIFVKNSYNCYCTYQKIKQSEIWSYYQLTTLCQQCKGHYIESLSSVFVVSEDSSVIKL